MSDVLEVEDDETLETDETKFKVPVEKYPSPKPVCDAAEFLRTVAKHEMEILLDNGLYRHLRLANPLNSNQWFELITWPDKLCISGDMGTFVFTRVTDMFTFFRRKNLQIDLQYWAEKCVARDRDGIEKFNTETFKNRIAEWAEQTEEATPELWAEIESEVLSRADDGEYAAISAAMDFTVYDDKRKRGRLYFQDFYEVDCKEYTYYFLWCCYAIAWAIQKYDATKENGGK